MCDYMAQKMDDQITGATSENEQLRVEINDLREQNRVLRHRADDMNSRFDRLQHDVAELLDVIGEVMDDVPSLDELIPSTTWTNVTRHFTASKDEKNTR